MILGPKHNGWFVSNFTTSQMIPNVLIVKSYQSALKQLLDLNVSASWTWGAQSITVRSFVFCLLNIILHYFSDGWIIKWLLADVAAQGCCNNEFHISTKVCFILSDKPWWYHYEIMRNLIKKYEILMKFSNCTRFWHDFRCNALIERH